MNETEELRELTIWQEQRIKDLEILISDHEASAKRIEKEFFDKGFAEGQKGNIVLATIHEPEEVKP